MMAAFYVLSRQAQTLSPAAIMASLRAIPTHRLVLAAGAAVVAYGALAGYDRIALMQLKRKMPLWFVTLVSFTTYALSHNIGGTIIAGGAMRYRAYSTRGMSLGEVTFLVLFCSFTFALGTVMLGGLLLVIDPALVERFAVLLDGIVHGLGFDRGSTVLAAPATLMAVARASGVVMLALVCLYVLGSLLGFKPIEMRWLHVHYPSPAVVWRQLIIAPLELVGAASIIYFALPPSAHADFITVLGVFMASFTAGLISHSPGGLGVLETLCVAALPEIAKPTMLAALIVFRLFYLVVPLCVSLVIAVVFERHRWRQAGLVPPLP
ncbi:MAG: YbhN family protein [Hyphomicrobiales bacterium]|nr:YbhN family protein [Hyphomicrobiales bacterium]